MQKIKLFSTILALGLFTNSYSNEEILPVSDKAQTASINGAHKIDVDPAALLKGELLSELLDGEMNGMRGYDSILHTMYDADDDGDKDLFMQVIFKRGDVTQDVFVFYYNNQLPVVDANFKPSFSAEHYHKLGSQGGDPRPCSICIFEKAEGNIFTFKDNTYGSNGDTLKFKLTSEEGIGLKWEKQ